eukprot:GHVU01231191.1.p1 GENE.GHVU01231191.1~~GHVU01231191.1.p1  ORF type:complete len:157 (-),score=0.99 GHVU01231191.1:405-875(-)
MSAPASEKFIRFATPLPLLLFILPSFPFHTDAQRLPREASFQPSSVPDYLLASLSTNQPWQRASLEAPSSRNGNRLPHSLSSSRVVLRRYDIDYRYTCIRTSDRLPPSLPLFYHSLIRVLAHSSIIRPPLLSLYYCHLPRRHAGILPNAGLSRTHR